MEILCPKCGYPLSRQHRSYLCENGHCYDIAREGYVNLILANQKHSRQPGDSEESLTSRARFLSRGYYQPLAEKLADTVGRYFHDGESFLDAGCGTGYYLKHVREHSGRKLQFFATDIAKKGVAMTAKANPEAVCFVGNVFHLPFDQQLEGLMSVFCPYSSDEFARVIVPGGIVIAVTPGKDHLYQLKETVYETPYYNQEEGYDLPQFDLVERSNVTYRRLIENNEDINTLWKMTPYYHTTSPSDNEKLLTLDSKETVMDFLVSVYRRKQND